MQSPIDGVRLGTEFSSPPGRWSSARVRKSRGRTCRRWHWSPPCTPRVRAGAAGRQVSDCRRSVVARRSVLGGFGRFPSPRTCRRCGTGGSPCTQVDGAGAGLAVRCLRTVPRRVARVRPISPGTWFRSRGRCPGSGTVGRCAGEGFPDAGAGLAGPGRTGSPSLQSVPFGSPPGADAGGALVVLRRKPRRRRACRSEHGVEQSPVAGLHTPRRDARRSPTTASPKRRCRQAGVADRAQAAALARALRQNGHTVSRRSTRTVHDRGDRVGPRDRRARDRVLLAGAGSRSDGQA